MFERNGLLLERKFREYLFPTMLTSVAVSLASVVDSIMVGNLLGETALSAVGLSGPVIYCLNTVYLLFAVGGVSCASIAKGRRNNEDANKVFTLSFAAGMAAMLVLLAGLLLFMRPITGALAQGDAQLEALTYAYLTPLVFVGPVMMLIMGMAQFVRTDGSPQISAWISIIANAVNLVLDYVLLRFFNTGIAGAAWSTVIGYVAGILVLIPYLLSKNRTFHFVLPKKEDFQWIIAIVRTGMAQALTEGLSFLRTLVLNALIMFSQGALGVAAMTVCTNALLIANMFIGGTTDTLVPIIGTLYGEKDIRGIRYTVKMASRILVIACVVVMAVFVVAPGALGRLFGISTEEGLEVLRPALRMYALSLPVFGVNQLLQNFYQTTGREKLAAIIATAQGFVFVVLFAFVLTAVDGGLIWLAYFLGELTTAGLVILIGRRIKKREPVTGVLMIREGKDEGEELDVSIPATTEAATGLSEEVIQFCLREGVDLSSANRMGIAVEEMAANTAQYGHKKKTGVIDVLIRLTKEELLIRLRDDGVPFDPTTYTKEEENQYEIGGIRLVETLAENINYMRQLGFNTTVITFPRAALAAALREN